MKTLALLSLFFLPPAARAQTGLTTGAAGQENLNALVRGAPTVVPDSRYEGLRGSPYVVPRWLPTALTMIRSKVTLPPVPLKYDVFQQRLLMYNKQKGDSLQLNSDLISSFVLVDAGQSEKAGQRRFRRFAEAPVLRQQLEFVEVLHAGKYELLKRYVKQLDKASYTGAFSADKRYDELIDKEEYYLRRPDGRLEPLKPTLKALQAAAPALAAALKAEADQQKLNGKSEAELVALLAAVDPAEE